MIRYKIQRKKVKKNEGRDPFKAVRLGCSLLWRTISYSHHILTKAGVAGNASLDASFRFGQATEGERLFASTYSTVYHNNTFANRSVMWYAGNGSVWSDIVTTASNHSQRPALMK